VIASLRSDAFESAQQFAADTDLSDAGLVGVQRWSIFVSPTEVAFVFEGEDVEQHVREWFDDPVLSTPISHWLPLFDGPLHAAREVRVWERDS